MDIQNNKQVHCVDAYTPRHVDTTQPQEIISFNINDLEAERELDDNTPILIKTNGFDRIVITNN